MAPIGENEYPQLIIYGGCFDPPHLGHVFCLATAAKFFPDAHFLVLPTYIPPGIKQKSKNPLLDFSTRLKLVKDVLLESLPALHSRIAVSDLEKDMPEPNYTVNLVRSIKLRYPGKRVALLMGQDQFADFSQWYKPEEILQEASLIIVARSDPGTQAKEKPTSTGRSKEIRQTFVEQLQTLGAFLRLSWEECDEDKCFALRQSSTPFSRLWFLDEKLHDASSSGLRACLHEGRSLPQGWLSREQEGIVTSLLPKVK